jgi:hypothetical protein
MYTIANIGKNGGQGMRFRRAGQTPGGILNYDQSMRLAKLRAPDE